MSEEDKNLERSTVESQVAPTRKGYGVGFPESLMPAGVLLFVFAPGLLFVADISAFYKPLLLVAIWWALLFFFWMSPAFCFFMLEKNWFLKMQAQLKSPSAKLLMAGAYYLVFWPICIPKKLCFYVFVVIGVAIVVTRQFY